MFWKRRRKFDFCNDKIKNSRHEYIEEQDEETNVLKFWQGNNRRSSKHEFDFSNESNNKDFINSIARRMF